SLKNWLPRDRNCRNCANARFVISAANWYPGASCGTVLCDDDPPCQDCAVPTPESPALIFASPLPARDRARAAISQHYLADEAQLMDRLLAIAEFPQGRADVQNVAADWVRRVRALRDERSPLDAFMHQYDLSSEEGVLLMCLAEA